MRFNVGPETYTVHITEEPLYHDGEEALGQCIYATREILLSPTLQLGHRLTTLLHELRHAWQFHVPRPRTAEEEADLSAMVMKSFWRDFNAQGGERALKQLGYVADVFLSTEAGEPPSAEWPEGHRTVPVEQMEPCEASVASAAGRASCGKCDMRIGDRSIVTSKMRWHFIAKGMVVDRTLFCPHCGHLQRWIEGADVQGIPNGSPLDEEPEYIRGAEVEEFLRRYPEAVGLVAT